MARYKTTCVPSPHRQDMCQAQEAGVRNTHTPSPVPTLSSDLPLSVLYCTIHDSKHCRRNVATSFHDNPYSPCGLRISNPSARHISYQSPFQTEGTPMAVSYSGCPSEALWNEKADKYTLRTLERDGVKVKNKKHVTSPGLTKKSRGYRLE